MKMNRLLSATAIAVLALAGTSLSAPAHAQKTLVIGIQADPTGLDPEAVLNNTSGFVMATIYDSLVRYKPGTVDVEPALAQSWDVTPDGLTYTFHLRKGVKFQDGSPFNAKTYVQGLNRLLDKNDPDSIFKTGPVEGYIDTTYEQLASYRAVDDDTVEFKLKTAYAPFITNLAMVWNGVVSPAAAHQYGKDFRNHPTGTGPFIFKEWRPGDQIVLDANPNYWGGKPKVDRIVFKEYPDPQAGLLALKRGDVQILGDLSSQAVPALKGDPNVVLMTQPGLAVSGIGLPTDTKPFNDKRVRQALNYAIDREAIDKSLYQGLAEPMTSPLPSSQWGFDSSLKGYSYDPAKAKELLKEAGYPNGFKAEFLSYNSARGYNPAGAELAVAVQGYLKKVGVETEIQKLEIGAFLAQIRSGKVWRHLHRGLDRRQRRSRQLPLRALRLRQDPGDQHAALQEPGSGQAHARRPEGARPRQARGALRQGAEGDPRRRALDLRELGAASPRRAQGSEGVCAEPDTDVLRHGESVAGIAGNSTARPRARAQTRALFLSSGGATARRRGYRP